MTIVEEKRVQLLIMISPPLKHPLTGRCLEHLSRDSIQKPSGKEGSCLLTRFITSIVKIRSFHRQANPAYR